MKGVTAIAAALVVLTGNVSFAAGADCFVGTWALESARSHYAEEALPQRMTIVIMPVPGGLDYRSDAQFADGRTASSYYRASFDGTPALVAGATGFLAPVSLTRVDETVIDAVYTSGKKKVAWSRWSVDPRTDELLVTTTYLDRRGAELTNVAAFQRVRS